MIWISAGDSRRRVVSRLGQLLKGNVSIAHRRTCLVLLILLSLPGCDCRSPVVETPTAPEESVPTSDNQPPVEPEPPRPPIAEELPIEPSSEKTPERLTDLATRRWIAARADPDQNMRAEAEAYLEDLGPQAVPALLLAINDPDAKLRRGAAVGLLARFNPWEPLLVEAFLQTLDDPEPQVRAIALPTVGQLEPQDAARAQRSLLTILGRPDEPLHHRATAARLLTRGLGDRQASWQALQAAVTQDPAVRVRRAALPGVVKHAPNAQAQVNLLVTVLSADRDARLRRQAARGLGELGVQAATAVGPLLAALDDTDTGVQQAAGLALAAIGRPAVPGLIERFEADDRRLRLMAIAVLARMGPAARAAAERLETMLDDADPMIRQAAKAALHQFRERPPAAVPNRDG